MYLLTHSLSPVLVLVVVMGSMELKTSRSLVLILSHSLSVPLSLAARSHADSLHDSLSRTVWFRSSICAMWIEQRMSSSCSRFSKNSNCCKHDW